VTRRPNVRYLTGFSGSNGQLLLSERGGVFLTDGRYTEQSRREVAGLDLRTYTQDLSAAFARACRDMGATRLGFEASGLTYATYEKLSEIDGVGLRPVGEEIEHFRWSKDSEEIALIARAQAFTDEAFSRVLPKLTEGITERDVAMELEWVMRQAGAEGAAFESIVAFGENAAEPHHGPGTRELRRGDVVKMDFGALCEGYHADMTRTVSFGKPPERLRDIHRVVFLAQQRGRAAIREGALAGDADRRAREVIEEAGFGEQFSHSLGHGVGLEIHEGPALRAHSREPLPMGSVVTVEPGVYVRGLGGVRIEDMVEVRADGCRVFPSSSRELVVL
jgi:Xaa-Pro aminopeptidase